MTSDSLTNPFDGLAADYDAAFTHSVIGGLMRRAVWRTLDRCFPPNSRILELNCGTGEDAIHLAQNQHQVLATDSSPAMIEVARSKASQVHVASSIEFRELSIERLDQLDEPAFDGVVSNFGGMNCVADLSRTSQQLARILKPNATVVLCLMGRFAPWEWLYYLARLSPRQAFRRLRRDGCQWRGMTIRYPSIRHLKSFFRHEFTVSRTRGVGVLVPPSYVEPWASRHPGVVGFLNRIERVLESFPLVPSFADHYVIELRRK